MKTIGDLKQLADEALFDDAYPEALALYTQVVELQPLNLDARLRIADGLMAMGEVQRAAVVYTELAKHAARAGYPLRALVAVKILATLEPKLAVLLGEIGKLYARDSEHLGRGVRRSPPDPNEALPEGTTPRATVDDDLAARAQAVGSSYEGSGMLYPDKLIPIPVLSLLEAAEFAAVLESIRLVRAKPKAPIIEEGQEGSSFFVVTRGSVSVMKAQRAVAELHEGAIFGEMSLLSEAPRSATVLSIQDCDLLEFDRDGLASASDTVASLKGALASFAQDRLLSNLMGSAGLFQPLDKKQRGDLMRRFVAVAAEPDTVIIRQGEHGRGLYVVLRGEVAVTREEEGHGVELARLGPTDMFGEISLLNDEPTSATVTATQSTTVLFLSRDYFSKLLEAMPAVREYLEQIGEDREMDTRISMAPMSEPPATAADDDIEVDVLI